TRGPASMPALAPKEKPLASLLLLLISPSLLKPIRAPHPSEAAQTALHSELCSSVPSSEGPWSSPASIPPHTSSLAPLLTCKATLIIGPSYSTNHCMELLELQCYSRPGLHISVKKHMCEHTSPQH
ncbi:hypothetical protein P7K49_028411, partial [Saguinus oedipus]